ncbi:TPA: hypothetical protein SOL44_003023 [Clostridioides difficile]|nr:hypothetical protein [Clostridioides difficile]
MKDISFKFLEDSNVIHCIENLDGRKKSYDINVSDFMSSLTSAYKTKQKKQIFKPIYNPIYKEHDNIKFIHSIQTNKNTYVYVFLRKKSPSPMSFGKDYYSDVGMPNLLFAIKVVNNIFSRLFIVASDTEHIKENTQLFFYPFTNTPGPETSACIGSNNINLNLNNFDNLFLIPNIFFSMPNTIDYFSIERNTKHLEFLALLEYLNHKTFDDNLLVECCIYDEWIKSICK